MKSINSGEHSARESLGHESEGANVVFLDQHISAAEMNALFASADCYISLHRSEGLGLGMAQAMYLGKPVIATNYSGNLEFMNSEQQSARELQHDHTGRGLRPLRTRDALGRTGRRARGQLMRWVYENRAESAALGSRAALQIQTVLNPQKTAAQINERVREVA